MYKITSKALSPYQIETTDGWITVPAMDSVVANLTDAQLDYVNGCGCYVVEETSGKAAVSKMETTTHNPAVKESLKSEPTEENTRVASPEIHAEVDAIVASHKASDRDQIIDELTERGIEFDGRMGAKKLRKLLNANN